MITTTSLDLATPVDTAIATDLTNARNVIYLARNVETALTRLASILAAHPRLIGSPRHHLVNDPDTTATARFHAADWTMLGLRAPDVLYIEPTRASTRDARQRRSAREESIVDWRRDLRVVYLREGNL